MSHWGAGHPESFEQIGEQVSVVASNMQLGLRMQPSPEIEVDAVHWV